MRQYRLDLFVEDNMVVDLKAVSELLDVHFAVVKSQLRSQPKTWFAAQFCQTDVGDQERDRAMKIPDFLAFL